MPRPSRPRILPLIAAFAGLALCVGFTGWAFYASEALTGSWESLGAMMPAVIVSLLLIGGVTGGLMWLAFYSSRHGYDEPLEMEDRDRP